MKRQAIFLTVLLAASAALACGQARDRSDGYWWLDLNPEWKVAYVQGFDEGISAVCQAIAPGAHPDHPCQQQGLVRLYIYPGSNITYGQIDDGLDHFYEDYRNRSVLVASAIPYVLLELKGADPQALEKYRRTLLYANQ
jgi:hypothetical protein